MRTKPCDACGADASVRYRIVDEADGPWRLVCPPCQARLSADNPHYRYGGTWKARKKRR